MTNTVRAFVGYVRGHTRPVAQTGYGTIGRDGVGRVHHIYQIAYRALDIMLAAQLAVVEDAPP